MTSIEDAERELTDAQHRLARLEERRENLATEHAHAVEGRRALLLGDDGERLVAEYWEPLEAIAIELAAAGALSGDQVRAIARRSAKGRELLGESSPAPVSRTRSAAAPRKHEVLAAGRLVGLIVEQPDGRWAAFDASNKCHGLFADQGGASRAIAASRASSGPMRHTTIGTMAENASVRRDTLRAMCRADGFDPTLHLGWWIREVLLYTPRPRSGGNFARSY
jgi:hypothetical protein